MGHWTQIMPGVFSGVPDKPVSVPRITPRADCPHCHGSGTVTDWVDYGSARVSMPSTCDCVWNQLPEDHDGDFEITDGRG